MSRNRGVVLVLVALLVVIVGGGILLLDRIGSVDGSGTGRGGPGGGAQGINARITDLDGAPQSQRRPDVGTAPPTTRLSPGGAAPVGGAAPARSGGAPAVPELAPPPCTVSLLQSILGLGVTLLGGRSTC